MNFIQVCEEEIQELNMSWEIKGVMDRNNMLYTLGTDTKLISQVFELKIMPILMQIAKKNNLKLKKAKNQNIYPDFTLLKNERDNAKIAIDVKTTYRHGFYKKGSKKYGYSPGALKPFQYTLGSYNSYLRNNTKNIQYPYNTYKKHYIIGFLYSRRTTEAQAMIENINAASENLSPYYDVEYFIQEKYKIAGEKPGSGNTENIGSFMTNNINDLREGKGPFSKLGQATFEEYWKNYGRHKGEKKYKTIKEFLTQK
ncbi:MAG: type II restriction endonuclease [bacterium]